MDRLYAFSEVRHEYLNVTEIIFMPERDKSIQKLMVRTHRFLTCDVCEFLLSQFSENLYHFQ
jgi:predicted metal-dependent HD superfamily phosphohydrolase